MGPTWVLSAPDGPHVGPMNLAMRAPLLQMKAIIWTNAGLLLIGPLKTNFRDILIKIKQFSFMEIYLELSSEKWQSFCFSLNVLKQTVYE